MNAKPIVKPAPLGRGLSALFGDTDASYQAPRKSAASAHAAPAAPKEKESASSKDGIRTLPITWLQPGAYQPRRTFDDYAIQELTASIEERGVLQPLMVRPLSEKDSYEIVCGERRWRAAQRAGIHEVPVIIRTMTDREAMEIGLIENIQRQDLSPIEEAEGYERLIEEFDYTQDNLSKIVGKSRPHITNFLRMLKLPEGVKELVSSGELTSRHARVLLTVKEPLALAKEIVKKGLNVRQTEALAKKLSEGHPEKLDRETKKFLDQSTIALERDLSSKLGLKAKIHTAGGKTGTLTLHFSDFDQLDNLIRRLSRESFSGQRIDFENYGTEPEGPSIRKL